MKIIDPIIAILVFHSITFSPEFPQNHSEPAKEVVNTLISQQFFRFSTHVIGNDYSVGVMFKPEVSGTVSKIRALIPDKGTYTVSLWDLESQELLLQTTVDQVDEEWSEVEVTTQQLQANRTYAITVFLPIGTRYYNVSELELPATVCGVQILSSVAAYGDSYPMDLRMPDALFGLIDFTFAAQSPQAYSSIF